MLGGETGLLFCRQLNSQDLHLQLRRQLWKKRSATGVENAAVILVSKIILNNVVKCNQLLNTAVIKFPANQQSHGWIPFKFSLENSCLVHTNSHSKERLAYFTTTDLACWEFSPFTTTFATFTTLFTSTKFITVKFRENWKRYRTLSTLAKRQRGLGQRKCDGRSKFESTTVPGTFVWRSRDVFASICALLSVQGVHRAEEIYVF